LFWEGEGQEGQGAREALIEDAKEGGASQEPVGGKPAQGRLVAEWPPAMSETEDASSVLPCASLLLPVRLQE
jgi:hypothetical protein